MTVARMQPLVLTPVAMTVSTLALVKSGSTLIS